MPRVTWQKDDKGINFWIVGDVPGTDTLKIGNKFKLQLEILSSDSIIYDSRQRGEALEFVYTEKLFSGTFGSALQLMTPGDSALLKMRVDQFYPNGKPRGLAKEDSINCRIKLVGLLP